MTVRWATLFDRGAEYDVTLEEIQTIDDDLANTRADTDGNDV